MLFFINTPDLSPSFFSAAFAPPPLKTTAREQQHSRNERGRSLLKEERNVSEPWGKQSKETKKHRTGPSTNPSPNPRPKASPEDQDREQA